MLYSAFDMNLSQLVNIDFLEQSVPIPRSKKRTKSLIFCTTCR